MVSSVVILTLDGRFAVGLTELIWLSIKGYEAKIGVVNRILFFLLCSFYQFDVNK